MKITRLTVSVFLLLMVFVSACNKTTKEVTTAPVPQPKESQPPKIEKKNVAENYTVFYKRFHSDSIFQISRVPFPISGYFTDTLGNEQTWNLGNWIMHRSVIQSVDTSVYKVKLTDEPTIKEELLYIEGGGFKVERKFKQIKGKWYLVYYVDENL